MVEQVTSASAAGSGADAAQKGRADQAHPTEYEAGLRFLTAVAQEAPAVLAMVTDVLDEQYRRAAEAGLDVQQRAGGVLGILVRLTEKENIEAIGSLIDSLPQLAKVGTLAGETPHLLAMVTDVFDEWAQELEQQGIDLETSLRQGLQAALWLGQHVSQRELERLGCLLAPGGGDASGRTVGDHASSSLQERTPKTGNISSPPRVGAFGLIKALFDPDVQRTLAFAMRFAKCFGQTTANPSEATGARQQHDQGVKP